MEPSRDFALLREGTPPAISPEGQHTSWFASQVSRDSPLARYLLSGLNCEFCPTEKAHRGLNPLGSYCEFSAG